MAICVTLGVLALSFLAGYQAHSQVVSSDRSGKPFVAYSRVLRFSSQQREPAVQQGTFARRSDGSFVRSFEVTSPAGEVGWSVDIVDVPNRKYVALEPFTKSATTFYRTDSEVGESVAATGTCDSLGLDAEAGLPTRRVQAISPQQRVWDTLLGRKVAQVIERFEVATTERWVAPDLDCFALRKSEWSSTGAHNEYTVTKLEEGEPPDSMFQIPSEYLETSPLQVEAAYAARYPGHALFGESMARLVDERYHKSRARRK